jgi:hypothetical protein
MSNPKNRARRSIVALHKPAMTALGAAPERGKTAKPWLERSGLDVPHHKGGPTDRNTNTAASTICCSGAAVGFTFLTLGNTFVTGLLLKSEHPKVVHSPSSLLLDHTDDRHLLAPD